MKIREGRTVLVLDLTPGEVLDVDLSSGIASAHPTGSVASTAAKLMSRLFEHPDPEIDSLRVEALHRLGVLDSLGDGSVDHFAKLAAQVFDTPIALVTLIDAERQRFVSSIGVEERDGTTRALAFCDHTIRQQGLMIVEDATLDPRFMDNPWVTGAPGIRFYAGSPLITTDGQAVGAICVLDVGPRTVSPSQEAMMGTLAEQIMTQWELGAARAVSADGATASSAVDVDRLQHLASLVSDGAVGCVETTVEGVILSANTAACRILGYRADELIGASARDLADPDHRAVTDAAITALVSGERSSYEATRVYRHRTGRTVYVRCSVRRTPATGNRPPRVMALLEDLTGRLDADTRRLVAERAREAILATATDAFVSIDHAGVVQDWNGAAEQLFGFSAAEAFMRPLWSLIVPEDSVERHRRGVAQVGLGAPSSLIGVPTELVARRKDGSELLVELTVWSTPDGGGKLNFHAFCRDIGERVASRTALTVANQRLTESREQLQAAFEASPTSEAIIDARGELVAVNPALCRFLGREVDTLVGHPWGVLLHELDSPLVERLLAEVRDTGRGVSRTEVRCVAAGDRAVWGLLTMYATGAGATGADDPGSRVVIRIEDISVYKDLQTALIRQVSHDPVSGLPNRAVFVERLRQALSQPGAEPIAVAVLTVDGLRDVIDRDGYAVGDAVVAQLASRLVDALDADVVLAHLQAAQFAMLVPQGAADAVRLAGRLLAAVKVPLELSDGEALLSGTVGIALATPSETHDDSVMGRAIQDAEAAAAVARTDGADNIAFASPEMRQQQRHRRSMELLIREALASDQIQVAYQPVFDLGTGLMVGAEALLRVRDAEGRPIAPLDLIPVAESTGQIVEIGRRVLVMAAEQSARWRADHGVIIPVGVNVSAVQLTRPDFLDDVYAALDRAGAPPECLSLELTESVLLEAGSHGVEKLRVLRDAGILLAIDDFGTGYASLSYLRELPAATLKIDRSFVEGIPHDHAAVAIVASVIGLAKNFDMSCIAEGIENETQLAYLAERGVLGQGYLLGRPASGEVIDAMLSQRNTSELRPVLRLRSAAEARDEAGDQRDQAGDQRDQVGDQRDQAGDQRDQAGDQRDEVGDRRDLQADQRDEAADRRDTIADRRDRAGTHRDEAADRRDQVASQLVEPGPGSALTSDVTDRLALARREAAADRHSAMQDREAGADERARAGLDRDTALNDRGAGASERFLAELDRNIASADRGSGFDERVQADEDRTTAHSDRNASAVDREVFALDDLTQAYRRGPGLLELEQQLRAGDGDLVLAFVDVDGLKAINDTAGHAAGDSVLRAVADALRQALRASDVVTRYGGDEFVVSLTGLPLAKVEQRFADVATTLARHPGAPTVTVGFAELLPNESSQALIDRADAAARARRSTTRRGA